MEDTAVDSAFNPFTIMPSQYYHEDGQNFTEHWCVAWQSLYIQYSS